MDAHPSGRDRDQGAPAGTRRRVAAAALVIMVGNVASRLLGLVREQVMAWLFGATGATDAFVAASAVPSMVYDFLVGGAISAALVPVLVEAARDEARFWRVVSAVFSLAAALLIVAAGVLALLAEPLVELLGAGFEPWQQVEAAAMVRVMLAAVVLQGLAGVLMAASYARDRFALPAFAPAIYNLAIIVLAVLLHAVLGVGALVAGVVVGAAGQLLLQVAGLGRLRLRPRLDLGLSEVRTILRLYAPVAAGLVVSFAGITIDRALASQLEAGSMSVMNYATRIIQFPIGLVVTALSLAVLPTLSKHAAAAAAGAGADSPAPGGVQADSAEQSGRQAFLATLTFGIKLGLLLMAPAALGLSLLSQPLVRLLFEHRAFTEYDTLRTATVFLFYAPQLPFVALDQLLIYAFYARRDTTTPVAIGVLAVGVYLAVALATMGPLGVNGLALANSAQNSLHGIVLLGLLWRTLGGLGARDLLGFSGRVLLATALMGAALQASLSLLTPGLSTSVPGLAALLALEVAIGAAVYAAAILALRVPEARQLADLLLVRLRRRTR